MLTLQSMTLITMSTYFEKKEKRKKMSCYRRLIVED